MNAYQIRKENLLKLMKGRKQAACADKWGTSASTLSQITSNKPVRNLGDALARKIEAAEGLPNGWLDTFHYDDASDENSASHVREGLGLYRLEVSDDASSNLDEVSLPMFREVEFAAGEGSTQVIENHGASIRFSLSKLLKAGVTPEAAACATVKGNSMEPRIPEGATIAIDKSDTKIRDGRIYALDHGGLLRVKKLYRLPMGQVRVVSENSIEYSEEVYRMGEPDAPRIIGRVFWWEAFD